MSDLLPPPCYLGAPEKFNRWNPDQAEALLYAIDSPKRFVGLVLPTGAGKTLVATMAHLLTGRRTAVLTSTKGLQDQMSRDFESVGLVSAMGQSAYECLAVRPEGPLAGATEYPATCDRGPCRARVPCPLKDAGCLYYDALRRAQRSPFFVTNYAYYLTQFKFGQGLGAIDTLVLDEAHAAPDELAGFLSTELRYEHIRVFLNAQPPQTRAWQTQRDQMLAWTAWADEHATRLGHMLERLGSWQDDAAGVSRPVEARDIQRVVRLTGIFRTLAIIAAMNPDDWMLHEEADRIVFDPIWVAGYAEPELFRGIEKVIFMSATFRPKTAQLLGLDLADVDFYEAKSGYDKRRRPVYLVKSAPRVDFKMDDDAVLRWIRLIDTILGWRRDRKGIIHTVSYKRRNQLMQMSRFRDCMISHASENARQIVAQFKHAAPGTILVSPSVTTGYDFPFEECEYQIVTKVPFPDSRDPILKARQQEDADFGAYLAMQELVQAVGRGMRAPTDQCETFIVDGHAVWFLSKFKDLAPRWFHEAVIRAADTLPEPLPKLSAQEHTIHA